jgi:putative ATPase involved in DNA repair
MESTKGSEWRRWELHIHTPDTQKNDNFTGSSSEEKWEKYYQDISTYIGSGDDPLKAVAVIAITDYLSIDNYKKVIADNKLPTSVKLVLPNVEMRIQPIANDSPINIHFVFNPDIISSIESRFFSKINFRYSSTTFSASHSELIRLGNTIDSSLEGLAAYKKGIEQFVPSFDKIQEVFLNDRELRDNTIIFVSNSSTDGVSGAVNHSDYLDGFQGDSQLKAFRQSIYKFVDGIFSATPSDIKYFLGKKSNCPVEVVAKECGSLKPCVHGSDAHKNEEIFEPDQQKYCWIKADTTFNGLKQILYEPEERVKISQTLPDYKAEYYVIDKVEFIDEDFQDAPINFNENLTCIIGGKSTGKSILLHNLANAIDPLQVKEKEEKSSPINKTIQNISVTWKDGKKDESRKIVYIPQTYLNRLSDAKESTTEIDRIIQDIVWIDAEAKSTYTSMLQSIKDYKSTLNMSILGLIENHKEINSLREDKKEIGDQEGIKAQIEKLSSRKEILSNELDLSKNDLDSYEKTVFEISTLKEQILLLQKDLAFLEEIDSLVEKRKLNYSFSNDIQNLIDITMNKAVEAADAIWKSSKHTILTNISNGLNEKENRQNELFEIRDSLKSKIQDNKVITEISNNIQQENDKLKNLKALEEKEKILVEKENKYIDDISLCIEKFKNFHTGYAETVNSKPEFKSSNLEFFVGVPFKKEAFLNKISMLLNNRSTIFKETISIDEFTEAQYSQDFLKDIICKILNDQLQPKKGNNKESVIRDICDDWFEIKYNVQMDNDTIDIMSPGKKALVLLKLLIDLADSKCPILIDQPEDDLDNRSVFKDLIPFIKKKKKDRQIIIVTHNANVVLGADAEEVIVANQKGSNAPNKKFKFEYRSGAIENNMPVYTDDGTIEQGILNSQGIQQHICDILEGGESAFELRKNKYHI